MLSSFQERRAQHDRSVVLRLAERASPPLLSFATLLSLKSLSSYLDSLAPSPWFQAHQPHKNVFISTAMTEMTSYFIEASTCEPLPNFIRRTNHLLCAGTNRLKSGKKMTKRRRPLLFCIMMSRYTAATRVRLGCGGKKREGWEGGRISSVVCSRRTYKLC